MTSFQNMSAGTATIAWQPYLDVSGDVVPWLQLPNPTGTLLSNLALITAMACEWVQQQLGKPIAPIQFDYRFDGWSSWNGAYIQLPYWPVQQVVTVTEYWGVNGPHVLQESTLADQVDGWQCDYTTGRLTRIFPGNVQKPWFPGSGNIEVTWIAGYDPIPARFTAGTLELIAHWWRNTQQVEALEGPGLGEYQYDTSDTRPGPFEGIPERVRTMLGLDMQVGIG